MNDGVVLEMDFRDAGLFAGFAKIESRLEQIERKFKDADKAKDKAFGGMGGGAGKFNVELGNLQNNVGRTTNMLSGLASVSGLAFSAIAVGVGAGATGAVSAAMDFEKLEAAYSTAFGSADIAAEKLKNLQEYASKTPFEFNKLAESFLQLKNRGFEPTNAELTKLGDLASSQNKEFGQLTEAILDAQTGEFERLKEFGITASKNGDKVALTFRGVTQEVQNNDKAIRDAISSYGDLNGIQGAMDAQSKTLAGRISTLKDNFAQAATNVGNVFLPIVGEGVDKISEFLGSLNPEAITEFFAPLNDWVVPALERAWDAIMQLWEALTGAGDQTEATGDQMSLAAKAFDFVSQVITLAANIVKAFADAIREAYEEGGLFTVVVDTIKFAVEGLYVLIKDINSLFADTNQEAIDAAKARDKVEADAVAKRKKEEDELGKYYERRDAEQEKAMKKTVAHTKAHSDASKKAKQEAEQLLKAYERLSQQLERQVDAAELDLASEADRIEIERTRALAEVDNLEKEVLAAAKAAKKKVDISAETATLRLAIEKEYQDKIKEMADKAINDDESKRLREPVAKLKSELERNLQAVPVVVSPNIEIEPQAAEKAAKSIAEKLQDALGVDSEGLAIIQDSIATVYGSIVEGIASANQAQIEANKQYIASLDDRINGTRTAYDRELELAKLGYANNLATEKEKLEALEKEREAARVKQEKLEERARRIQLRADAIQQTSSLLVATANQFKAGSGFGPVGIAIAVAAIASMFSIFSKFKSQARKLRRGGMLEGPLHEFGGIPIGDTGIEVEGGEFVMNREATRQYRPQLEAMNNRVYPGLAVAAPDFFPVAWGNYRYKKAAAELAKTKIEIEARRHSDAVVRAIAMQTHELRDASNRKPSVTALPDGRLFKTYKEGNKTVTEIVTLSQ